MYNFNGFLKFDKCCRNKSILPSNPCDVLDECFYKCLKYSQNETLLEMLLEQCEKYS